ncbi:MAG: hypothetical protein KTR31_41375 [Myxococcales bacterium]|nr:hypothetical protein [Myxococcales bacterium]
MISNFRIGFLALVVGCVNTGETDTDTTTTDTGTTDTTGGDTSDTGTVVLPDVSDAIDYRDDLAAHPGCSTAGLAYTAATIPGYTCAAKEYVGTEDTDKPVVVLIHGNSDTPSSWETYDSGGLCPKGANEGADMVTERLVADGYRVIAADMRFDLVDDPAGNNDTENTAKNMDHGWGVPIAQHLIGSVLEAYPDRQVSIIGFSFGVTVARDAVRRLAINDEVAVFERIDDMILLAGANHGVSTFFLCGVNPTMRGEVTCEMGDRAAYSPTPFLTPLNGPEGAFETPCSDGTSAFGRPDACNGHSVDYTTVVMEDLPGGEQQDLFVSEASSYLEGADNQTIGLNDFDESNYFFCGLFANHYGAARSIPALDIIDARLAD